MNFSPQEFSQFQNIEENTAFVINLPHRSDRWQNIHSNCGHIFDLRKIDGIIDDIPWKGCYRSHQKIIHYANQANVNSVLVLEDDCHILDENSFSEKWFQIKQWLDNHMDQWDVFLGGTTIFGFPHFSNIDIPIIPINIDLGIVQIEKAYTAHFIYYNKSIFSNILDNPMNRTFDESLDQYKILISCPFLAIQKESYSDIEKLWTNNTNLFHESEIKIQNYLVNSSF